MVKRTIVPSAMSLLLRLIYSPNEAQLLQPQNLIAICLSPGDVISMTKINAIMA